MAWVVQAERPVLLVAWATAFEQADPSLTRRPSGEVQGECASLRTSLGWPEAPGR